MAERDGIASHLKHLVERLLLQNIEDKHGTSGSLHYHLGCMKICSAKLPRASINQDTLHAQNGALTVTGKYHFTYQSIFQLSGDGDFDVNMYDLSVSISEPLRNRHRRRLCSSNGEIDSDTVLWYIQQGAIICKVGKIKTKFHGTSSRLCQIASRILIRLMRTQLETRVAEFVKELLQGDEERAVIAILGLFALNTEDRNVVPPEPRRSRFRQLLHRFRHRINSGNR